MTVPLKHQHVKRHIDESIILSPQRGDVEKNPPQQTSSKRLFNDLPGYFLTYLQPGIDEGHGTRTNFAAVEHVLHGQLHICAWILGDEQVR